MEKDKLLLESITNEDNMALMARYPDKHFDLAIVDPPYGIKAAKTIGRRKKWNSYKVEKHLKKDWDNNIPSEDYFKELFRISKNQIIWGSNYFIMPPTKGIVAWDKMCDNTSFSDFELAWTSFNVASIIIRIPIQQESQIRIHPTQKPVKLYKKLLDRFANKGDKILDTHLGSGSIAIACHDYGFDLTACELDPEYYELAMKRINNHMAQKKLFQP